MSKIDLNNISHSYNTNDPEPKYALNPFSMTWENGKRYAILGPSGCGKTTMLNIVSGLVRPSAGNILFDDKDVTDLKTESRNIAQVFHFPVIYNTMTVYENLAFPLKVRKMDNVEIEDRIQKTLSMVSLSEFGNRMPAQLSGGQQQRVAVARALVFDPAVVLMDEPLGALDKNLRESMQYELKSIHEKLGVTVVYVTHDQGEALTMSNRIAVFNDGNVQQLSTPSELYESPVNSFVAQFIGENNTFSGTVKEINNEKATVQTESGEMITANPIAVSSVGEKTTVSLRPERVIINPESNIENQFDCQVKEIIYHGDHTRLRVSLLKNDDFILKIPNSEKKSEISTGTSIKLGWSSSDCRALD